MGRYAILSDIHANLAALQTVSGDLATRQVDAIYCLGDFVVYGPRPRECMALAYAMLAEPNRAADFAQMDDAEIQKLVAEFDSGENHANWTSRAVMGNNDYAIAQNQEGEHVVDDWLAQMNLTDSTLTGQDGDRERRISATQSSHNWTKGILSQHERARLGQLATSPIFLSDDVMLVHASPCEAIGKEGDYLREERDAEEALVCLGKITRPVQICFVGHTHRALAFQETTNGRVYDNVSKTNYAGIKNIPTLLPIGAQRLIVNPGSVGQPRDGDRRAAYAIYDDAQSRIEFYRVEYDIERTIRDLEAVANSNSELQNVKQEMGARLREGR
ncbi:metallophosphoesterase family protein [Anaerolineae bacterium CFX7]|nr:metallophosphoesterase family protein [Anaerolineae bacterium CFX7]